MSGPIIFDELNDSSYEPQDEEILEYAKYLGIDPVKEKKYLWIAREGLKAPLPDHWKAVQSEEKDEIYYFNFKTGESIWDHPCDEYYKKLFQEEKKKDAKKSQGGTSSQSPNLPAKQAPLVSSALPPKKAIDILKKTPLPELKSNTSEIKSENTKNVGEKLSSKSESDVESKYRDLVKLTVSNELKKHQGLLKESEDVQEENAPIESETHSDTLQKSSSSNQNTTKQEGSQPQLNLEKERLEEIERRAQEKFEKMKEDYEKELKRFSQEEANTLKAELDAKSKETLKLFEVKENELLQQTQKWKEEQARIETEGIARMKKLEQELKSKEENFLESISSLKVTLKGTGKLTEKQSGENIDIQNMNIQDNKTEFNDLSGLDSFQQRPISRLSSLSKDDLFSESSIHIPELSELSENDNNVNNGDEDLSGDLADLHLILAQEEEQLKKSRALIQKHSNELKRKQDELVKMRQKWKSDVSVLQNSSTTRSPQDISYQKGVLKETKRNLEHKASMINEEVKQLQATRSFIQQNEQKLKDMSDQLKQSVIGRITPEIPTDSKGQQRKEIEKMDKTFILNSLAEIESELSKLLEIVKPLKDLNKENMSPLFPLEHENSTPSSLLSSYPSDIDTESTLSSVNTTRPTTKSPRRRKYKRNPSFQNEKSSSYPHFTPHQPQVPSDYYLFTQPQTFQGQQHLLKWEMSRLNAHEILLKHSYWLREMKEKLEKETEKSYLNNNLSKYTTKFTPTPSFFTLTPNMNQDYHIRISSKPKKL